MIYLLILLELIDPTYLGYALFDQYLHLRDSSHDLQPIRRMLGRLFSALLSSLQRTSYRLRIYSNDSRDLNNPSPFRLRLFGCLSFETEPLDAELNKTLRLRNFVVLHTSINRQVCPCDLYCQVLT